MPGRYPNARSGAWVRNPPGGFPLFADGRRSIIVTSDPWSLVRHLAAKRLSTKQEGVALAYIDQGVDFFEAARNPQLGSKPLLYYYSFLNVVKAALLIHGIALPPKNQHGISDPKANHRTRLRFAGQTIRWEGRAADHSLIFPELLHFLAGSAVPAGNAKVTDLLAQVPSIHRTFCQVEDRQPNFLPVASVGLLHRDGKVWARLAFRISDARSDKMLERARTRRAFTSLLSQVHPDNDQEVWFETETVPGSRRGLDNGLRQLAIQIRTAGIYCALTNTGYKYYISSMEPRTRLPQLAAVFASVFYLGSLTRYKPYDFDKILTGGYSWVIGEFLNTQPTQFIYTIASHLAGTAVVRPFAII
jgi:hypothetical protein